MLVTLFFRKVAYLHGRFLFRYARRCIYMDDDLFFQNDDLFTLWMGFLFSWGHYLQGRCSIFLKRSLLALSDSVCSTKVRHRPGIGADTPQR